MNSKYYNYRLWKILFIILIVTGSVGAIFFFPLKLDSSHTCICHKMICEKETCCQKGLTMTNSHMGKITHHGMNKNSELHHAELLNQYLFPFAFLWWGSLILLFSGFYLMKKYSYKKTA